MKTNTSSGWNQAIIKTYTWLSHRAIPEKNSNKAIIKTYPLLSHWAIPEKNSNRAIIKTYPLLSHWAIPIRIQTGKVEDILFRTLPWNFYICHFTLWNFRQNKLSSLEILQCVWHPLEIPQSKTKTHGNSTILLFKLTPRISTYSFLNAPANSISSDPHLDFFCTAVQTAWILKWNQNLTKSDFQLNPNISRTKNDERVL